MKSAIPIKFIREWYHTHKSDYLHYIINQAEVKIILDDLIDAWYQEEGEWEDGRTETE